MNVTVPTGCDSDGRFAFDAMDRMYYTCDSGTTLWRDGAMLTSGIEDFGPVLADGRSVVIRAGRVEVVAPDGHALVTYDPTTDFEGGLQLDGSACSTQGNDGVLVFNRSRTDAPNEVVLLRIDASNRIMPMRRVVGEPTTQFGIVDGTLFRYESDPLGSLGDERVVMFAPDGTQQVIFRDATATYRVHGDLEFMTGPLR